MCHLISLHFCSTWIWWSDHRIIIFNFCYFVKTVLKWFFMSDWHCQTVEHGLMKMMFLHFHQVCLQLKHQQDIRNVFGLALVPGEAAAYRCCPWLNIIHQSLCQNRLFAHVRTSELHFCERLKNVKLMRNSWHNRFQEGPLCFRIWCCYHINRLLSVSP